MTRPRDDPARRCLPVADWPSGERRIWNRALAPCADVLADAGAAAHWRAGTRRSVENAYGRWLIFLATRGTLDPDQGAGERATEDRLRGYIEELQTQIASITVAGRIRDLNIALNILDPGYDDSTLRMVRQRLKVRARPERDKRSALVGPEHLLSLAGTLFNRADDPAGGRADWRACNYRDGVILLVLVFRPLRRANLVDLVFGRTLFDEDTHYRIAFDGSAMKNHRDYEADLPAFLTPFVRTYLERYRPILLRRRTSDHLWISSRGQPLDDASLYGNIVRHTRTAFGKPLSPHMFRDAAATFLGEENPELVRLATTLLHHADSRTTQDHYNHARADHSVRDYQRVVTERRSNPAAKMPADAKAVR